MDYRETTNFANSSLVQWNLNDWTFGFNKNKRRLGVCKHKEKRIEVSIYHLTNDDEDVKNTILHEIAHAICPKRGHGIEWKRCCRLVGAIPERCGTSSLDHAPHKWELKCSTCNHISKMHRKPKRRLACAKCCKVYNFNRFSEKYVLTLVQVR